MSYGFPAILRPQEGRGRYQKPVLACGRTDPCFASAFRRRTQSRGS